MSNRSRADVPWIHAAAWLLLFGVLLTVSLPANASTATLKRSISNITQAPLDLVFSPMVGLISVVEGMLEQDDPFWVPVGFALPGYVWNTGVNIGLSAIRFVTGGLELIPGVALLPFEADVGVLFSPVESAGALFEMDTPCCIDIKFGIDYTAAAY